MQKHHVELGAGDGRRTLAVEARDGQGSRGAPALLWLGGFRSDMRATKAEALDELAARTGRRFVRFDYSGHGESGGRFEDGTLSRWLEDARAVAERFAGERPVLVGSSMGGWIALLLARALQGTPASPSGLVLVAPAVDFTERLMWAALPEEARAAILDDGVYLRPSAYSPDPTPITRALIEDGRRHLLLGQPFTVGCPVHILQGMRDPDVPWTHALELVEHLPGDPVQLTLVNDGDHRLSRPEDLERLAAAVEGVIAAGER